MNGNGKSLTTFISESMIKEANSEIRYELHCMYDEMYQKFFKLHEDFNRLQGYVASLRTENNMLRERIVCLESAINN